MITAVLGLLLGVLAVPVVLFLAVFIVVGPTAVMHGTAAGGMKDPEAQSDRRVDVEERREAAVSTPWVRLARLWGFVCVTLLFGLLMSLVGWMFDASRLEAFGSQVVSWTFWPCWLGPPLMGWFRWRDTIHGREAESPSDCDASARNVGHDGLGGFADLRLHDATLRTLQVTWATSEAVAEIVPVRGSSSTTGLLRLTWLDCTGMSAPQDAPWGSSAAINAHGRDGRRFWFEMQSGDVVEVWASDVRIERLASAGGSPEAQG